MLTIVRETLVHFSTKELRQRQNAIRGLLGRFPNSHGVWTATDRELWEDELLLIYEILKERGSPNPAGSLDAVKNLEEQ